MTISLVAHIPHQAVLRCFEYVVQGDGEFDGAKVGRQMAAGFGYRFKQKAAQLLRQEWQLFRCELAQVIGKGNGFEQGIGHQNFRSTI